MRIQGTIGGGLFSRRSKSKALIILWLTAVCCLEAALVFHMSTPAARSSAIYNFPISAGRLHHPGRPTLVLFAHPLCPCSTASIEELSKLMSHINGRLDAYVFFLKPRGVQSGWERSAAWYEASMIPGVAVMCDEQGKMAAKFRATTSGSTYLYDQDGHLVFNGGITFARGHVGENEGSETILATVLDKSSDRKCTNVFGCSLLDGALDSSKALMRANREE